MSGKLSPFFMVYFIVSIVVIFFLCIFIPAFSSSNFKLDFNVVNPSPVLNNYEITGSGFIWPTPRIHYNYL